MIIDNIFEIFGENFREGWSILWTYAPLWLPILLGVALFRTWINYIRARWIQGEGSVLLEIKIPIEVNKSPAAMELIFAQFYQASKPNYIAAYIEGKIRPWFALEIVSIGGEIRFFIWAHRKFKKLVEAHIYAQYPNVEVYEVEDYAKKVPFDPDNFSFWATHFKLTKPDAYPIKTYIEYGLDKDPKEEFKIDPMTSLIEYMGSIKKGEQVWIQILIRAHRDEGLKDVRLFKREDWSGGTEEAIKKIMEKAIVDKETQRPSMMLLDEEQKSLVSSIRRNLGKFPFDTMIRGFYIGEKEAFDGTNIPGLIGSLRQFSSNTRNGFKLGKFSAFDYPWEDFRNLRRRTIERRMLDAYKRRSYFYPPHQYYRHQTPYILTTEELATIFHFPGQVASTPTFSRIVSKKGKPPANLPM